jgi:hypothetical protein
MELWRFLCFTVLFCIMVSFWYDIRVIGGTTRELSNFLRHVEFAPGYLPGDVRDRRDVYAYMRGVMVALYSNSSEYGYSGESSPTPHLLRFYKLLDSVSIIADRAKAVPCTGYAWEDNSDHVFKVGTCYKLPGSAEGRSKAESGIETLSLNDGLASALARVDRLEAEGFIDDAAHTVKIQLWVHNAQTRYTSRVRVFFSFDAYGSTKFEGLRVFNVRLYNYTGAVDYFVGMLQALYLVWVAKFLRDAVVSMRQLMGEHHEGRLQGFLAYATDPWVILEWLSNALNLAGGVLHLVYISGRGRGDLMRNAGGDFGLEWIPDFARYAFGLGAMLLSWRLLKHFEFEPQLSMLVKTVKRAWPTLTFFFANIVVILTGYAIGGFMILGGQGNDLFRTFGDSLGTCFRMTTTEIDLDALNPGNAANRATVNAIYFWYWTYILLVFFVLLQMFIAIVLGAYDEVLKSIQSSVADHANLLKCILDGIRILKQTLLTKIFRTPNGTIPKICEDHAMVLLINMHNDGKINFKPQELEDMMAQTQGGKPMVEWLVYLEGLKRIKLEKAKEL